MTAGSIQVELIVTDHAGRPAPDELDIGLTLEMIGHPMAPTTINLLPERGGAFRTPPLELMQGRWQGQLTVPDGHLLFNVDSAG